MAVQDNSDLAYFVFGFPLSGRAWHRYAVRSVLPDDLSRDLNDPSYEIRKLADRINTDPGSDTAVHDLAVGRDVGPLQIPAEILLALRTLNEALRWVAQQYFLRDNPGSLDRCRQWAGRRLGADIVANLFQSFVELFPPLAVQLARRTPHDYLTTSTEDITGYNASTVEMVLLFLNGINPAVGKTQALFDDDELRRRASFIPFVTGLEDYLDEFEPAGREGSSIFQLLRAPMQASPDSLAGQIEYIRLNWGHLLPENLLKRLQTALDVLQEVDVKRLAEYGPPPVLDFGRESAAWDLDEPEAYSRDADWMSNVVLMAKSTYVWLDQLTRWHGRPIRTLAEVPDEELDKLARWGVTGLWLIGLWERSDASRRIKQYMGNPEAAASAYSLREYTIAGDLGGEEAYGNLRERAAARGIRLASDMVPNHMGIDSHWVLDHPDWFLQSERPPYPAYSFTGGDLCEHPHVSIRIEDGYWNHSDAAVVFQRVDERHGDVRYIYHGNDGTSMPWNDTAQLNFLMPEVREAVIQVILDVARKFPIIRFDAAMTLAKKHYQRLWFPAPGDSGAIPSRAEHGLSKAEFDRFFPIEFWREVVDRVAAEAPDTLLLAEAFWLMEGYFVRTLGMHRVYNSAFMNMLKMEDNSKYRQTIKNVLEFSPEILKRFVNFMNNPDERTAVEQFGRGDKYFGCATLLVTMPGLPMLGHGQIEGFSEKYGMEYRRAYWDEDVDQEMVRRHEREIFPLMRRRHLFSGAEHFALYDFETDGGWMDENVFAYSNRSGGDRGLILFNNAYEATSGRIELSTAINTGSGDSPHLQRRTLAEALGIDAQYWYIFRDHAAQLEFIKSGQELVDGGFHTHLNGYEYRALVDFREVADHDGAWSHLAASLGGGGVPDMQQALRRATIAPALAQLAALTEPEALAALEITLTRDAARATADDDTDFADYLEQQRGNLTIPATVMRSILQSLTPDPEADSRLQLAGVEVAAEDRPLFAQDMRHHLVEWSGNEFLANATLTLAEALVHAGQLTTCLLEQARSSKPAGRQSAKPQTPKTSTPSKTKAAKPAPTRLAWFAEALIRPEFAAVLGVNDYEGTTYLSREGLDSLLDGLVCSVLFDQGLVLQDLAEELDNMLPGAATVPATSDDAADPNADSLLESLLEIVDLIRFQAQEAGYEAGLLARQIRGNML